MGKIISITIIYFLVAYFVSWWPFEKYKLHKFYKDPLSPAAILMGGTYAGTLEKFDVLEECMILKRQAEDEDKRIGYANSSFRCSKNSEEHYMKIYNNK